MAEIYVVDVALPSKTGLPEDEAHNIWTFQKYSAANYAVDAALIFARLASFYDDVPPGEIISISEFISTDRVTDDFLTMTFYFTDDETGGSDLGPPVAGPLTRDRVNSPPQALNLPDEVAVVMSFHADLEGIPETADGPPGGPARIRPASRRRGRLFLGPLAYNAQTQDATTQVPYFTPGYRSVIGNAAEALIEQNGEDALYWVVWSKTGNELNPVVGGYVDDAFDTQRRRGVDATGRVSF